MIELNGEYTNGIIYNDEVDEVSIGQVIGFLNHPAFKDATPRFMPDIHAGAGAVIGTTAKITDMVIPNTIGVDIGCGVVAFVVPKNRDFENLDNLVRERIPFGTNVNDKYERDYIKSIYEKLNIKIPFKSFELSVEELAIRSDQKVERVFSSIGSLGSGNHFIEVDEGKENDYLIIHSGSRGFGLGVANYHQKIASNLCEKNGIRVLKDMEFLEGPSAKNYYDDLKIAQIYAHLNRMVMGKRILENFYKVDTFDYVESVHNYIDFERGVLRKGAISAEEGEIILIPLNMRDGVLICKGKGNKEWNYSAPHGAGRLFSRRKAKENLSLDEFEEKMKDVWSSCVKASTLDESPMAYKNSDTIKKYIEPTAEIIEHTKVLYNFKA
jgi:tRNA-splicing ligase RtcB (3'-phosphate/5'-hydroxy nucleic acid ligase)